MALLQATPRVFKQGGHFPVWYLDLTPRLATAPSAGAREPQSQQENNRSDCSVDDEADDTGAEMNSKAMQKPVADESADDANGRVADETETAPSDNLARQPSGNDPDDQNHNQPLVRQMHVLPFALRSDSRRGRQHCNDIRAQDKLEELTPSDLMDR